MPRNLFIGGCVDGQVMETNGEQRRGAARSLCRSLEEQMRDVLTAQWDTEAEISQYQKVTPRAGGSEVSIYLDEKIARQAQSQDELSEFALHALINGYARQEDEQRRRPTAPKTAAPSVTQMQAATEKTDGELSQFQREALEMLKIGVLKDAAEMRWEGEVARDAYSLAQHDDGRA